MTLRHFLLMTVASAGMISVCGAAYAADTAVPPPQVLGASVPGSAAAASAPSALAAPGVVPAPGVAVQNIPTPPSDMPPPPSAASLKGVPEVKPDPDTITAAPPAPVPVTTQPPPMPAPAAPSQASAMPPPGSVSAPPSPDLMQAVSGDSATQKVVSDKKKPEQPDVYYDSHMTVPTGPLANSVGPRKVDPTTEPASELVISKKTYASGDIESMLVAANRALDLDQNGAALEMFDALYKRNPRDPRILMGRAVAQQKTGKDDLAILSYQNLLDVDPRNANAMVNLMGLIGKQYPAVALRRLTDLQEKFPGNPMISAQLGLTYAQTGDNDSAIKALATAASLDPQNAQHDFNLAVIYDRMSNKSQAIAYYEKALENDAVYGGGHSVPRDRIYDRLSQLRQ